MGNSLQAAQILAPFWAMRGAAHLELPKRESESEDEHDDHVAVASRCYSTTGLRGAFIVFRVGYTGQTNQELRLRQPAICVQHSRVD